MYVDELHNNIVLFPLDSEVFVEVGGVLLPIESIQDDSQGVVIKLNENDKDLR
jgi:hypothetical protein